MPFLEKLQLFFSPLVKSFPQNLFSLAKKIFTSSQNVIGVDFGTNYIKIVQLQKSSSGYFIVNCDIKYIPLEFNDSPEKKRVLIYDVINKFIADTPVKTNLGRLVISGKGVFVFSLLVPLLSKKDLKGAVSIELKKRMPFQIDLSNISFDYYITGQTKDERGANLIQVSCIAAANNLLEENIEILKALGIKPSVINTIPDVLANLIPFCLEERANQTVAVLDIGANVCLLNFYKEDMLQFSREIPIGGKHITEELTKPITTHICSINMSFEEAEEFKQKYGIPLEEDANTVYITPYGTLLGSQVFTILRPTLERLLVELIRTFNYYSKTFRSVNSIGGLYLTGGSCQLKNIDKFLKSNLEDVKKVERIDTLKAIEGWLATDKKDIDTRAAKEMYASHLSAAISVCIGKGGRVNLLPAKEKLEQRLNFIHRTINIIFPAVLTIGFLFYAYIFLDSFRYKRYVAEREENINTLTPFVDKIKEYLALKSKIDLRRNLLEDAVGRQPIWWGVLKELSVITPQEVILEGIVTNKDKEKGLEIRLTGKILAKYTTVDLALSQYLLALDESPFFAEVEWKSTNKDMYSVIPRASFEIACKLQY